MAAPTAVDSAVSNPGGTGSTLTVILPATQAVGDVIYLWITNSGNTLWAGNPAGWSRKDQRTVGTSSNGLVGTLLFRTLVSGDTLPLTNPVCTLGATVTREAVAWTERGADVQGVHVLTEWGMNGHATGTANPIRPPTVITSSPEMHAIHCYGQRSATNAPEPTGYTQLTNGQVVISGTLVTNVSTKTVADQQTSLANQDASPTSGARWVACILCIPSPDYAYFRSTSQTLTSGGGVTGTLPTGTTDADVNGRAEGMLAIVKAAGSGVTITPTGGEWADVAGWDIDTSTGSDSVEVFAAEYSVGISLNFGRSGSGGIALRLITYRNIHQTDFIGNSNARQNAGTPAPWDAQSRQNTKSTIVAIICADADTNSVHVPPTGYLERGDNFGLGVADQVFNASGTTASASWTTTNAANVAGLVELLSHAGVGTSADLVIQNASHSHSAENLTLTQVHSLVVQDASHSHTAQNNVLTQVHSLAVQDASHAHTAENLALVETHVLTVQDATHDHTAGSLTLTQVHSLAVQNATHGHTADNLTLTQVHSLTIDSASHDHTAENLTLTQVHSLAVQDASHAHTAENLTLAAEGDLAIANASHGHTSENVVLTQVHQLVVSDSSHAHSAENVAITSSTDLVVQSASHGHTADNLTLTQVHTLTIQDAAHGHSAENIVLAAEGTLGIQNGSHAHTAENVTLTQVHTLAIQNASHGHTAESLTLTEVYNLTVQSASHAHSAENLTLTQVHSLTVSSSTHSHTAQNLGLGSQNNLLISDSFHAHTTSGILFNWVIPEDVYVVQSENTTFTVVESQIFTVPSEDNIFEV